MRVAVISDTHLRDGLRGLPDAVRFVIDAADVTLHAGDFVAASVVAELRSVTTLHAVLGNNDLELVGALPETLVVDLAGVSVALIHDSGARIGRPARLAKRFPTADVVVFGHSHVPLDQAGLRSQLLFNPGSPTQRRAQPHATYGELELSDGAVVARRIVEL